MNLIDSIRQKDTYTENGMLTNSTSLSSTVDFFFTAGAMRKSDNKTIIDKFSKAYTENSGMELVPNSTIKAKAQFDMISPNSQKLAISLGSRLKFWLR